MAWEVDLAVFQGPFDLLLELIARRRMDVTEVDLAEITGDYIASLGGLDDVDLDTATRFLVVAATLIELKAARLLPSDDAEEEHDLLAQARDLLYARLLEYQAFRDVAGLFEARFERNAGHHARHVPLDPRFRRLVPDAPLGVDPPQLATLAARALRRSTTEEVELDHIRRTFLSIRDAAQIVLDRVATVGAHTTFRTMVRGRGRTDAVVVFLAALELYKLGQVDLTQDGSRAELRVSRRDAAGDLSVMIAQPTRAAIDGTGAVATGGPAFELRDGRIDPHAESVQSPPVSSDDEPVAPEVPVGVR